MFICNRFGRVFFNKIFNSQDIVRPAQINTDNKRYSTVKLSHKIYTSNVEKEDTLPLIVIHGLFGSKKNWHTLAKCISTIGKICVITVDVRNHGSSPHTDDMDYHLMSADVVQLITDLGLSKVNLLGHSMGGKVAMTLSLKQPDLVEKLIVEDVSPCTSDVPLSQTSKYINVMTNVKFDHSLNILKARRCISQQICSVIQDKKVRNFILTNVIQDGDTFQWKINLHGIGKNFNYISGFPEFETSFIGETLFIGGKLSKYIRPEDEYGIKVLFPQAEIVYIRRAGHWVHHDTPGDFLQTVLTFLKHRKPNNHN